MYNLLQKVVFYTGGRKLHLCFVPSFKQILKIALSVIRFVSFSYGHNLQISFWCFIHHWTPATLQFPCAPHSVNSTAVIPLSKSVFKQHNVFSKEVLLLINVCPLVSPSAWHITVYTVELNGNWITWLFTICYLPYSVLESTLYKHIQHIFNSSSITPEAFFYSPKFCLSSLGCSGYCPFHLTQASLLICAFPLVIWMDSRYWACLGTWRAKECPYSPVTYSAQSKRAEIRMAWPLFHPWDGMGPHICISVKWTEITLAFKTRCSDTAIVPIWQITLILWLPAPYSPVLN